MNQEIYPHVENPLLLHVREAYGRAIENGYEAQLKQMNAEEFALDLHMYESYFENINYDDVLNAVHIFYRNK